MATKKITDLTALTTTAAGDYLIIVDISDTSMAASGTDKKITLTNLAATWGVGGATADSTNKLSVNSDAVLFNHNGTTSQVKVNKNATANTASHLFQVGFSGRAEFGLIGSDDFTLKTSPDGSAFTTALTANKTTGAIATPVSLSVGGGTAVLKVLSATATLDFASISAQTGADLTVTVTGAKVGDSVAIGLPAAPLAGVAFMGFVSATDTVTVRAMNYTGSSKDPASATYRVTVYNYT